MTDPTSTASVVVAGWVGSNNLGDELIHRVLLRELRSLGASPKSVSRDPRRTSAQFGVPAFRAPKLLSELNGARGLVFGGGTLIQQDSSLLNIGVHLQRLRAARWRRIPSVAVGLGVGMIRTPLARRAVRRELGAATRVVVRDDDSKQALEAVGFRSSEVGCDLVFAEPTVGIEPTDSIAVGLRPPLGGGILPTAVRRLQHADAWLTAMADALDATASATGLAIRFIAMDRVRDHAVHKAVASRMQSSVETACPDLDGVLAEFAEARATIGMRYHAAVAALVGGRPAVGLAYSQKVSSLEAETDGAVIASGLTVSDLASLPQTVEAALDRTDRAAPALERQRARLPVVREALSEVAG